MDLRLRLLAQARLRRGLCRTRHVLSLDWVACGCALSVMRSSLLSLAAMIVPSTLARPSQRVLRSRDVDQSNLIAPTDYDVMSDLFAQSSGQSVDVVRLLCTDIADPSRTIRRPALACSAATGATFAVASAL